MSAATVSRRIRARALELGFGGVRLARVAPLEAVERYEAWLAAGMHGGLDWLARPEARERRRDPARILPGLRAVVCVALSHEPAADPERDRRLGRIARYAAGEDYHAVMRDRLRALARFVEEALPGARALWYADTGAILERGWAERAGLGWIGKHGGLLSTTLGSWFLLGEVLVDRDLEPDPPVDREHCGTCQRCLDACPTRAIVAPYRVDARRCVSYLTIEHRGIIPLELRAGVGDWIFGCDLCQEVCPWNRFAPPAREARLHARALEGWSLERFLELDEPGFATLFAASPICRAGRDGFLRNVCVALGNRGRVAAAPPLARALRGDPAWLVRAHAAWALGEVLARADGADADGEARHDGPGAGGAPRADRGAGADASPEPWLAALRDARAFDTSVAVREEAAAAIERCRESATV
jgi:epoxyqueuosine reductase